MYIDPRRKVQVMNKFIANAVQDGLPGIYIDELILREKRLNSTNKIYPPLTKIDFLEIYLDAILKGNPVDTRYINILRNRIDRLKSQQKQHRSFETSTSM